MKDRRIILCGNRGPGFNAVFHALKTSLDIALVLVERKPPFPGRLFRRAGRWGWFKVFGQVAFCRLLLPGLRRRAEPRVKGIQETFSLETGPLQGVRTVHVPSVNHPAALRLLKETPASVVAVFGSSIISGGTLEEVPAPFVNLHLGLSRYYRGLSCTYWARVDGRPDRCGVTVHLIDSGVDSGPILEEKVVKPRPEDTFASCEWWNLAEGLPLFRDVLARVCDGGVPNERFPGGKGVQKTIPTAWEYLWNRKTKGVS